MRILMLSWRYVDHPAAGGAEVLTHEVLRRLVEAGADVTCFSALYAGAKRESWIDGVRVLRAGRQWTVHLHAWRWLRRRLESYDRVIDQVNTIPFCTPLYVPRDKRLLFICQLARGYWWRETRGLFRLAAPFGYVAEPWVLRLYRGAPVITISQSTAADLVPLGVGEDQLTVIPMALTGARGELGTKGDGDWRIAMVGRLTPAKFVEEGIRAFARFKSAVPDASLDVVGGGDERYRARLEHLVDREGITGVTFHGRVSEERKTEILASAHLHLFTSHREGWGLVVSEAAAVGTPSVGYEVQGVRDSIADVRLLAPCGDFPGLAQRMLSLYRDPALYEEIRHEAWMRTADMTYDETAKVFADALLTIRGSLRASHEEPGRTHTAT